LAITEDLLLTAEPKAKSNTSFFDVGDDQILSQFDTNSFYQNNNNFIQENVDNIHNFQLTTNQNITNDNNDNNDQNDIDYSNEIVSHLNNNCLPSIFTQRSLDVSISQTNIRRVNKNLKNNLNKKM